MIKHLTCLALLMLCFHLSRAQDGNDDKLIAKTYANISSPLNEQDTLHYYLVKFNRPPVRESLRLLKRVSYNYYIVSSQDRITAGKNILSVASSNSLWKADDGLVLLGQKHPHAKKLINVVVRKQSSAVVNRIKDNGTIISTAGNIFTVKVSLNQLAAILAHPDILFATAVRQAHEELDIKDIDLGSNNISAIADNFPGINGAGINVSIKEDKYDEADLDLLGRSFTSVSPSDKVSAHATIMATLIGGNGNSFIRGLGSAPAVKFTSSYFARLLPDTVAAFQINHISVQNHSYGTGIENFYGIEAEAYDKQLYETDSLIHVFSSGNIGHTTPATGLYKGVPNNANLSGTFKQAKNVLVVGGTGRTNVPEALSSAGPAYDGRIKPDIIADGEDGTSGAAALTTGAVALLQQAFKNQYKKLPAAALIKSVLINSADDIGIPAVDHKTGYGKLNVLEALRTINGNRFKTGSVAKKQETTYEFTVPRNCRELKVSLAWTDVPAALNAPTALVNDLDLYLTTPSGRTLLPWTLSTFPQPDSLLKPAIRARDSLNNTEQVTLQDPATGAYTIHIIGNKVTTAVQSFYVAYQVRLANQFEWTSPSGNNKIFAAEENYLRWQSTYNTTTGNLGISYDHGVSWTKIADVDLKSDFYKWTAPRIFKPAMLKVTINGEDHISKEFVISKPLSLNVGYNCADGILLHWNPQRGALLYNIYTIKDNVLQQLTTSPDTSVIIPAQMQSSKYFAVSAQGNGFEGIKSFTIDAASQGVGCYVKTLLANVAENSGIALQLTLGSVLNLRSITWEKLTGSNLYTALGNTNINTNMLTYGFTDAGPKTGINYYRAKLTAVDGKIIYSDLASATYLRGNQFTLFPNPVTTELTVLAGEQKDFEIKFYNTAGKISLRQTFNGLQNNIPIHLIPGAYLCTITLNGKILFTTKIVKAL